jgi:hypothetical protein
MTEHALRPELPVLPPHMARDFADACFEAGRLTRQPAQGDIE